MKFPVLWLPFLSVFGGGGGEGGNRKMIYLAWNLRVPLMYDLVLLCKTRQIQLQRKKNNYYHINESKSLTTFQSSFLLIFITCSAYSPPPLV